MPSRCCTRMTGRRALRTASERSMFFGASSSSGELPIGDKKGVRGVTRRLAVFVPNHGPDAVRWPVLGCHTLAKCLQTLCKRLQSVCKPTL